MEFRAVVEAGRGPDGFSEGGAQPKPVLDHLVAEPIRGGLPPEGGPRDILAEAAVRRAHRAFLGCGEREELVPCAGRPLQSPRRGRLQRRAGPSRRGAVPQDPIEGADALAGEGCPADRRVVE